MARVLLVGIATVDIINEVERYPAEDEEVRALAQERRRGGNAANTAVVLAQLGHRCELAATLVREADLPIVTDDLARHGVGLAHATWCDRGKLPTSYIVRNRANGSRTIVHHRDLPEYGAGAFAAIPLDGIDWIHFEGRNVEALALMLADARARAPRAYISLEAEKPRPHLETLFSIPDLLLFSRVYARSHGFDEAAQFLLSVPAAAARVCAWGEAGAVAIGADGKLSRAPAFPPERLVDTLGAGDAFNAGIIDARLRGRPLADAVVAAARLAGRKCGRRGFDGIAQTPGHP